MYLFIIYYLFADFPIQFVIFSGHLSFKFVFIKSIFSLGLHASSESLELKTFRLYCLHERFNFTCNSTNDLRVYATIAKTALRVYYVRNVCSNIYKADFYFILALEC